MDQSALNKMMKDWLREYPVGTRIEWYGPGSPREGARWHPAVVTQVYPRPDDPIISFRLDSEQSQHIPHEVHWEYRGHIRRRVPVNHE